MEGIKTNYKEVKNKELNGIELYFDSIPNYNERQILKSNGFKWHNVKKCWYKKEGTENKKEIKKDLELKEIRKATEEELQKIITEQYPNDKKMQDFLVKSYDFYMLKDGYYFEVEKFSKLSINKTMWYDDETEGPEENEANFILYNMNMNDPFSHIQAYLEEKESLQSRGCASGAYDYKGMYIENFTNNPKRINQIYINFYNDKRGNTIRYLSNEEMQDYINIKKEVKEKYLERLHKYYKKYGSHVHACGYWVNR